MAGTAVEFRVAMRPGKHHALPETPDGKLQDLIETAKAHIRCKINVLAALTNLLLARRCLLGTA